MALLCRTLLRLAWPLVGSVLLNVAVAWGISLLLDPFKIDVPSPNRFDWGRQGARVEDGDFFHAHVLSCPGAARLSAGMREAGEFERDHAEDPRTILPRWWTDAHQKFDQAEPFYARAEARGWPLLSMWHGVEYWDHVAGRGRMRSPGGLEVPLPVWLDPEPYSNYDQPRTLPLRIIWRNFAINSLFYACGLWLLMVAPGAIRRRRRLARGLCPACAYPRGASERCSECGAHITPSVY